MTKLKIKLDYHLEKSGLTQMELKNLSGVRQETISKLKNNKLDRVTLKHLESLMDALGIDDISELVEVIKD